MPRIFITFIFILIVIGLGWFLLLPKYQELEDIKLQIIQKHGEIQYRAEYVVAMKELYQGLEKYRENLSKIEDSLPFEHSRPAFFNHLRQLAVPGGLLLTEISFLYALPHKERRDIILHRYDLSFIGFYAGLKHFLSAMENSTRFITIERIILTSPEEGEEHFYFNFMIKVHSLIPQQEGRN